MFRHPAIEGAINARATILSKGLNLSDITSVVATINPEVLVLTGQTDPQTGLEGKFSVFHGVAVGLLYGEATPAQFTNSVVLNSTVVALRKLVNTTVNASVAEDSAYVSVLFADGTNITQFIEHVIGSLDNPLSTAQLKTKFITQSQLIVGSERAEKAYEAFLNIGNLSDVSQVAQMFFGANGTSSNTTSTTSSGSHKVFSVNYMNGLIVFTVLSLGLALLL